MSLPKKSGVWVFVTGVIIGVAYGLSGRVLLGADLFGRWASVMTLGFLFGVPFAMGFITTYVIERRQSQSPWTWILATCTAIVGGTLGTLVVSLEGMICIVMFFPIALVCGILGAILAGLLLRFVRGSSTNNIVAGAVLLFPVLIAPVERQVFYSKEIHTTENTMDIKAPPSVVWANIERVRAIQPSELPESWSHRIGFPDPIEATLSHEGIGGVRLATFTGGVLFVETIDAWDAGRRLGFSIKAQTDQIPNTTLDEHVRVGGPFFDVLHGEYRLEPLANGAVRLHLRGDQRISTDFNWYARLWSDAVMSDLQSRILVVIKDRCERK